MGLPTNRDAASVGGRHVLGARLAVPTLVLMLALVLVGCRGIASSGGEPASDGQGASAASAGESGPARVVIDRDCSTLGDSGDEYVCLKNEDQRPADMSSWVLRNVLGRSYRFPPGFTLEPGQTVKVHTGAGTDSATDLYWNYQVNPAWETTDKLILHNSENAEVFVSEPKR